MLKLGITLAADEVLLYREDLAAGRVYLTTQRLAMDWAAAWLWGQVEAVDAGQREGAGGGDGGGAEEGVSQGVQ